ncbi:HXXEE domain-containing protein [Actinomyces marmotae]|uniref:HXXEE domain-containing protein n=1 Tax=Actinomyces marmotae TaxID=2737173 RepID=UPI001358F568|nr:HXXEE domain-containing protein [Actinomyces marmotae]
MDRVDLATAGLFFSWAAHDLEEYVTMPSASRELAERIPWLPEELRRDGVSREHVRVVMGIMAVLFAVGSIQGQRSRGRSWLYQALLHGYGLHGFSHLGSAALARGYTCGCATALPIVLPSWLWARRVLCEEGIEVRPNWWVIPAFPIVTGIAHGAAHLVTRGRQGGSSGS